MEKFVIKNRINEWGAKRESLQNKVEQKVSTILNIWNFTKENKKTDPDEFEKKAEKKMEETVAPFGKDFVARYDDFCDKKEKLQELEDELRELNENYYGENDEINEGYLFGESEKGVSEEAELNDYEEEIKFGYQEIAKVQDKILVIEKEIEKLKSDDIMFVYKINNFLDEAIHKKEVVHKLKSIYQNNPDVFWAQAGFITNIGSEDLQRKVLEIRFSGYAVNIVLPAEFYKEEIEKKGSGRHFGGTVFNIISQGKYFEETIAHEENHNLAESFVENVLYKEGLIENILQRMHRINLLEKINAPNLIIEERLDKLKNFLEKYYQKNFAELVADFSRSPQKNIANYFVRIKDSVMAVEQIINETKDSKIKEALKFGFEKMKNRAVSSVDKLSRIFFVSEKFGDMEKTRAALILFGLERLDKVERYCRQYIGKEYWDSALALMSFSGNGEYFEIIRSSKKIINEELLLSFLEGKSPKKLTSLGKFIMSIGKFSNKDSFFQSQKLLALNRDLSFIKEKYGEEELQKFSELIKEEKVPEFFYAPDLGWSENMDELLLIDRELKKLSQIMGVEIFKDYVEDIFAPIYFEYLFGEALKKNDFRDITEFFKRWPLSKEKFVYFLKKNISSGDIFLDYKKNLEKENGLSQEENIQKSKFWKFMEDCGLSKVANNVLPKKD